MRKFVPILIIVTAIAVYEGRAMLLAPFQLPQATDTGGPTDLGSASPVETDDMGTMAVETETVVTRGSIARGASFFVEMQQAGLEAVEVSRLRPVMS